MQSKLMSFDFCRVTRLFMLGACSKEHKNNFGSFPRSALPVTGMSSALALRPAAGFFRTVGLTTHKFKCPRLAALADGLRLTVAKPKDIRQPVGRRAFDGGHICNDGYEGVLGALLAWQH